MKSMSIIIFLLVVNHVIGRPLQQFDALKRLMYHNHEEPETQQLVPDLQLPPTRSNTVFTCSKRTDTIFKQSTKINIRGVPMA